MRRFIVPDAPVNVALRVVTVSVVLGLLVAACGPIDYAETLRYERRDYRTKCRTVRDN